MLAGDLLGVLLRRHLQEGGSAWRFAARVLGYAAALGAAGCSSCTPERRPPAFIVSKNHATVPWGLVSSALTWRRLGGSSSSWWTSWAFRRWPRSFAIAGENPLVAYLMAPFLLSVFALLTPLFGGTNAYVALGGTTGIGLVRSAVFAWLVVRLSGWMRSRGVRIQL